MLTLSKSKIHHMNAAENLWDV